LGDEEEGLKRVAGDAVRLLVAARGPVAAAIFVGAGLYTAADVLLEPPEALRATGVVGLVILYLQLLVTARALHIKESTRPGWDARRPTGGRYPRAFGISIVSTIAILAGLLLLVVPGVVLLLRWSLAYPVMLAEDEGIVGSLRRSWRLTGKRWPLLLGYGGLLLCLYGAAVALSVLFYPDFGRVPLLPALAANLGFMAAQIFTWLLTVALYILLRSGEETGEAEERGVAL
jgi:hypothetical protein